MDRTAAIEALRWHIDNGADEALSDTPVDATAFAPAAPAASPVPQTGPAASRPPPPEMIPAPGAAGAASLLGAAEAKKEAIRVAREATTLEALRDAIAAFDGISLKKTATNLVFSDGNPQAAVMVVGEAPGADEDREGKPFVGDHGRLLDKILAAIGLDRNAEDPASAVYITNILNWRPPGDRKPSAAEIDVSVPFIEKHIALAQPKLIIFKGGMSITALLGSGETMSKKRGRFHDYAPLTAGLFDTPPAAIPAMVTYHPTYLLRTPGQKKLVWHDMLMFQQKRRELGLLKD